MIMIGKVGAELDQANLDELCQERMLHRRQEIRDEINSKLERIVNNYRAPPEELARPYGVEREGEAYDVWSLILQQVTDPCEIRKLWKVSEFFRDILRGKYIETKLPEIVKLVLDRHPAYLLPDGARMNERKWRVSTFLKFRMTSMQSKRSLEHIAELVKLKYDITCLRMKTIEKVERISAVLMANPSKAASFFPANVIINDGIGPTRFAPAIDEFHQATTFFLSRAGKRIQFFTYITSMEDHRGMYDCLREWVAHMPNLTLLSIHYNYWIPHEEPAPALEAITAFPHLSQLQFFDERSGNLPSWYTKRILEACPGITTLRLIDNHTMGSLKEHSPQMLESLAHLTSVQIFPSRSLLDQLHLPWKLTQLNLHRKGIQDERPGPTISSCRIFSFVKQFEETLERLVVEGFQITDSCCGSGYLELRNLKTLKIDLDDSFENLNFLLYAERLEAVKIHIGREFAMNMEPDLELRRIVERSFLGKGVWEVFPCLKWIHLETAMWTDAKGVFKEFRMPF